MFGIAVMAEYYLPSVVEQCWPLREVLDCPGPL